MTHHVDSNSSINEILQMLKNYKVGKKCQESHNELDFQENQTPTPPDFESTIFSFHNTKPSLYNTKNFKNKRSSNIADKLHRSSQKIDSFWKCQQLDHSTLASNTNDTFVRYNNKNVFEKLYDQRKELDNRRQKLLEEGRKSIEAEERKKCTFSPNVRKRKDEGLVQIQNNVNFYDRNIQWVKRKDKNIKVKQCEKTNESVVELTFTPRINHYKRKHRKQDKQNSPALSANKGVQQYFTRQKKAKQQKQFIECRKKTPYSHVWNIKKGHFSYIK